MIIKLFLILLVLNLATAFAQANAGELTRHLDALSAAQIGADNANSQPSEVGTGENIERAVSMIGNRWFKSLIGISQLRESDGRSASLGEMLRESEYDLRLSDDDVLMSMTYRF